MKMFTRVDSDKKSHSKVFHLGLDSVPNYQLIGFQNDKKGFLYEIA